MRPVRWALIQSDVCPIRKGNLDTQRDAREAHTENDLVRTLGEDGCLPAKGRGSRRGPLSRLLDLGHWPPGLGEGRPLVCQPLPASCVLLRKPEQSNTRAKVKTWALGVKELQRRAFFFCKQESNRYFHIAGRFSEIRTENLPFSLTTGWPLFL